MDMGEHKLDASVTTSRWDRDLEPRLTIESGDRVTVEMLDASGGQVRPGMTGEAFAGIDKTRIHALSGPIRVAEAVPGDVLKVEILEVRHRGWAWTSIIPGLGLLDDRFDCHFLHHWELEGDKTRSLPGTELDLAPFCGVMGVQRAEPGEFRTRPPGPYGGNMDVKHLVAGSTLYLPVLVEGAGFCCGDSHGAQGDGEVCINGMEAPMEATFAFSVEKGRSLRGPQAVVPRIELSRRYASAPWTGFIESDEDPRRACRRVVERAMEAIGERIPVSPEQAYVLCSVVLDLKVSQLVNVPMTTVTGYLPEAIFL